MNLPALYFGLVKAYPLASSAIQVALLGTFGELLAGRLRGRGWNPFTVPQLAAKVLVWAFLGLAFKLAFTGFAGFVDALQARGFWPEAGTLLRAFSISLWCNALFGPVMMAFHRLADHRIEGAGPVDWKSLEPAWRTLAWFWLPAHTLTFCLPAEFQVGLAALWAVILGVILGLAGGPAPSAR
jgi:hypothetical protein